MPVDVELVLPERVTVALAELVGAASEGLLALAVGTGLGVLGRLLQADIERLTGRKGPPQPLVGPRSATAPSPAGSPWTAAGWGRRPRVRSADGAAELALPIWQVFASTELLDQLVLERMLAMLSTRRYRYGLEPVGGQAEQASSGTSKSAVSRRFVAATEHALAELLAQDLSGLDLLTLLVDGIRAHLRCGVGDHPGRHQGPLAPAEGASRERHRRTRPAGRAARARLKVTRPLLVVIDGAKALRRAVLFDHPVIRRCQLHKLWNVTDRLPDALASTVAKRMRAAYRNPDPLIAQAELEALARELDRSYRGAAASLLEGLAETLTIRRLGVPPTLARTLRSTNAIELDLPGEVQTPSRHPCL